MERIGKFFGIDTKIQRLDISNNGITDEGVLHLRDSLNQNETLEYLSLCYIY